MTIYVSHYNMLKFETGLIMTAIVCCVYKTSDVLHKATLDICGQSTFVSKSTLIYLSFSFRSLQIMGLRLYYARIKLVVTWNLSVSGECLFNLWQGEVLSAKIYSRWIPFYSYFEHVPQHLQLLCEWTIVYWIGKHALEKNEASFYPIRPFV